MPTSPRDILNAAFENLTRKRQQLDDQIAEIKQMLGSPGKDTDTPEAPKGKSDAYRRL